MGWQRLAWVSHSTGSAGGNERDSGAGVRAVRQWHCQRADESGQRRRVESAASAGPAHVQRQHGWRLHVLQPAAAQPSAAQPTPHPAPTFPTTTQSATAQSAAA